MNAVSEYFFWNEFGIRYNFIAVDYLIYTNEVIGNINGELPCGAAVFWGICSSIGAHYMGICKDKIGFDLYSNPIAEEYICA